MKSKNNSLPFNRCKMKFLNQNIAMMLNLKKYSNWKIRLNNLKFKIMKKTALLRIFKIQKLTFLKNKII